MTAPERIVIVGGSLAGLRAAETLRGEGHEGSITVVAAEPGAPYDRPPLSKQVLVGEWDGDRVALAAGADESLELTWRRGVRATALDLATNTVTLDDGEPLSYDGLILATGATPRWLPGTQGVPGVHVLRTLDDALAIRDAASGDGARVVVIGAGFIGAEVAASCRSMGAAVTLVEPLPTPLARVLGEAVGQVVAEVHRDQGVDLRLGVGVSAVEAGPDGPVVRLADGDELAADVVVVGIGVAPVTDWLEGSGLRIDDGVVCDETTLAAPGVVACGDVARWPNPRYGGELMRVEHWEHALDMGAHAARRLLAGDDGGEPFAPVPFFWSDQYDRKIQLAGRVRPDDDLEVVAGSFADRRFCALYGRDGRVVGALGMNMPAKVIRYRRQLGEGPLGWDEALEAAAAQAAGS